MHQFLLCSPQLFKGTDCILKLGERHYLLSMGEFLNGTSYEKESSKKRTLGSSDFLIIPHF
jgi:hypothetical protein